MDRRKEQTTLMDRHNKCVADILKHFMGLCAAATQPIDDHYTTEVAVLNSMKMENESSALIKQVENLLQLSREMKTLWVTGPLITNASDEVKALEAQIDAKTEAVCAMFNQWMNMRSRNVKEVALAQAAQANQKQPQEQASGVTEGSRMDGGA